MSQVRDEGTEILKVLCGSRAYGLNDAKSDYDFHHVFVLPTKRWLDIGPKPKETAWDEGDDDNIGWEIKHFLEMAVNCNPTILDTFVAPRILLPNGFNQWGDSIRELFRAVLSRERIFDAYRGYAKNQRTKMFEPANNDKEMAKRQKFATAYLRSLWHGIDLLNKGTYNPIIPEGEFKDFLMALRNNNIGTLYQVVKWAEVLEADLRLAYEQSMVQDEPNLEKVNEFLMTVRKAWW